jgi:hypothetical protein
VTSSPWSIEMVSIGIHLGPSTHFKSIFARS